MPDPETMRRAKKDKDEGKAASTQAGEFVKEEMEHIREGKHGARSAKQAIAIGLSKARRAGVDLPPPAKGKTSEKTRKSAESARRAGQEKSPKRKPSPTRSKATEAALKRETAAASHIALSRQAHSAARHRTAADRSAAAKKAVRTKGHAGLVKAGHKAARTRKANAGE